MRLVIYDATRKPSLLDESWGLGAFSMWFRGRTDGMLGALSWEEIFNWLLIRSKKGKIKEVQFWGHGSPGKAHINGVSIVNKLGNPKWADIMDEHGLWWFRTCSTFHGYKGKKFANTFANTIKCRVAAHTHKIGFPYHSGLHSIRPGESASWSDKEGLKGGELMKSGLWRPNTIGFWRSTIPREW